MDGECVIKDAFLSKHGKCTHEKLEIVDGDCVIKPVYECSYGSDIKNLNAFTVCSAYNDEATCGANADCQYVGIACLPKCMGPQDEASCTSLSISDGNCSWTVKSN